MEELAQAWGAGSNPVSAKDMIALARTHEEVGEGPTQQLHLNSLLLPGENIRSGTPRLWKPRLVPASTVLLAGALLTEVNPTARTMESLVSSFHLFQELNPGPIDVQIMLFTIDSVIQGLKASSARTYLRTLLSALHRAGVEIKSPLIGDTFSILELILVEEDVDHAIDICSDCAWKLYDQLQGDSKIAAFFAVSAGCRIADVARLKRRDVIFSLDGLI